MFSNPFELSSLNGNNGFVINGIDTEDYSGISVSNAGDINGDGFNDIIIGANGADLSYDGAIYDNAGESYVVFGSNDGFGESFNLADLNGSNGFKISGVFGNEESGISVSSAGDIDGDGFDDIIIGAFRSQVSYTETGRSYVVFGKSSEFSPIIDPFTFNGNDGFVINGIDFRDFSGISVSSAGDVNGDDIDDLIIGASGADVDNNSINKGESYIVFGNKNRFGASFNLADLNGDNGNNGFQINGVDNGDESGSSVSGAGDINGDGIDDLIIGAKDADADNDNINSGESYVIFGSKDGFEESFNLADLNGDNGFQINGIDDDDESGSSVSSAGDINGDGIDDLIIGAKSADINGFIDAGESYVIFGSKDGFEESFNLAELNGDNGFQINGAAVFDLSGYSVSSAGDINNDGIDDLIIGAPFISSFRDNSPGKSYVVFGSKDGFEANLNLEELNGDNGFQINGVANGDGTGISVSGTGDVNGDNIDDLIIGASGANGGAGVSYVIFGMSSGEINGTEGDDSLIGTSNDDTINGLGGDDTLVGLGGNDSLNGDEGNDSLSGGQGNNILEGGAGDDILDGTSGTNNLNGGSGDDSFYLGEGLSTLDGGEGIDRLQIPSGGDINEVIILSRTEGEYELSQTSVGFSDADRNNVNSATVFGTKEFKSIEVIQGTNSSDNITFSGSIDQGFQINAGSDNDTLVAGSNNDILNGEAGNDILRGRGGDDSLIGGEGDDTVEAGLGNDTVDGGEGNDTLKIEVLFQDYVLSQEADDSSLLTLLDANGQEISSITFTSIEQFLDSDGNEIEFKDTPKPFQNINLSDLNGTNGFVINGIDPGDQSGISVRSAGDFNGDGFDDFIIGARYADPNGNNNAGESYVVFGKNTNTGFSSSFNFSELDGSNGFVINGIDPGDASGFSVSGAGDVNDDGIDDIIIGAPTADPNGIDFAGESYVVFGSNSDFDASLDLSNLDGNNGFIINGINYTDASGHSVSSVGDINGDGIDDIIIGARDADSYAGASYVVLGSDSGFNASVNLSDLDGNKGFVIYGIDAFDRSGFSVSGAGDFNGDGIDDIIIGAKYGDSNEIDSTGESYVIFGNHMNNGFSSSFNPSELDGSNGFVINGIDSNDQSGFSVSGAGDFNGDGFDDIIIGASYADPNGNSAAGESYVVFGNSSGLSPFLDLNDLNSTNGFIINGIDSNDASGRSVSSAGDFNNDGFDDLIIGASGADPNSIDNAGESYVVFGNSSGFSPSLDLNDLNGTNGLIINGIDSSDFSGISVSSAGDFNNDGFDDLIIGARDADPNGNSAAGESYVIFGGMPEGSIPLLDL